MRKRSFTQVHINATRVYLDRYSALYGVRNHSSQAVMPYMFLCDRKISVMPNGAITARCHYCWLFTTVHLRSEDDYVYWIGWYCDACTDWIDINEEHLRLFSIMQMADSTMAHPLSRIIADSVGRIIASFRVQTWTPDIGDGHDSGDSQSGGIEFGRAYGW